MPIQIEADKLDIQDTKGITHYSGNVIVSQGETKILGEQVKISHPNRTLLNLTATGAPAKFHHFDAEQQLQIHGQANTIIYFAQEREIHLIGNAYLTQQDSHTIQGPSLIYDMNELTLQAGSNEAYTGRVIMTFEPQKQAD
ncbi:lipopolysaccharide transport periplasmic protein LptA [Thiomicrospira microaerophila]|uniref:lipopolysaccharide transport periplasmic protein LptA n=1 Tax=Thiomicrospira microaerophila TaxID=406020 RepID=UPI00200FA91A|nr:lipopolysaccharide transport periplasmic protein LptA [Thiomicrospira microaerophila]UQB42921.1 lipopolysaccharide transport periplasmic protein LptA [Thiomicrospira microaerophila]